MARERSERPIYKLHYVCHGRVAQIKTQAIPINIERSSIYKSLLIEGKIRNGYDDFTKLDIFCGQFSDADDLKKHLIEEEILLIVEQWPLDVHFDIRTTNPRPNLKIRQYKILFSGYNHFLDAPYDTLVKYLMAKLEANDLFFFKIIASELGNISNARLGVPLAKFIKSLKVVASESEQTNFRYLSMFLVERDGVHKIVRFVNSLLYGLSRRYEPDRIGLPQLDGYLLHIFIEAIMKYEEEKYSLILVPNKKNDNGEPISLDITASPEYQRLVSEGIIKNNMDPVTRIDIFCSRFDNTGAIISHLRKNGLLSMDDSSIANFDIKIGTFKGCKGKRTKALPLLFLEDADYICDPASKITQILNEQLEDNNLDFFNTLFKEFDNLAKNFFTESTIEIMSRLNSRVQNTYDEAFCKMLINQLVASILYGKDKVPDNKDDIPINGLALHAFTLCIKKSLDQIERRRVRNYTPDSGQTSFL